MAFGKKKAASKTQANKITLTNIATGHSYQYAYDPKYPASQNLERFLKEFDDEGYPMFFADHKIPNLNVRVRNADIEKRMLHYQTERATRMSTFNPAALDKTAQTKVEKQLKKAKNEKAAKAVKPSHGEANE